ncbi:hypothetical protein HK099_003034 [Clydaea vesicula]|uniref:Uncharacterized protein n=1 Tax=Clydaea vesicula TaxID=447962 RepID=A0AAD5Y139_9FUNG|nr:hypothetical protein HK099_003034 [Clydaea vesicula]KAJ3395836.1 hypothetical protein HDU92_004849 [Lobulomyces angularis]
MKFQILIILASIIATISAEEFTKEEIFCSSYSWKGVFYMAHYEHLTELSCYDYGYTQGMVYPKKMFKSNPKIEKCGVHVTTMEDVPDIVKTYPPCKGATVNAHYMFKPKSLRKLGKFLYLKTLEEVLD